MPCPSEFVGTPVARGPGRPAAVAAAGMRCASLPSLANNNRQCRRGPAQFRICLDQLNTSLTQRAFSSRRSYAHLFSPSLNTFPLNLGARSSATQLSCPHGPRALASEASAPRGLGTPRRRRRSSGRQRHAVRRAPVEILPRPVTVSAALTPPQLAQRRASCTQGLRTCAARAAD
jgi:hypothetical protein